MGADSLNLFTLCFEIIAFSALTLLVGGDGGGGHWLVRMEWRPAGWSVFLPLLVFPCTIKSRSSILAPAHPGRPGKSFLHQTNSKAQQESLHNKHYIITIATIFLNQMTRSA